MLSVRGQYVEYVPMLFSVDDRYPVFDTIISICCMDVRSII